METERHEGTPQIEVDRGINLRRSVETLLVEYDRLTD